MSNILQQFEQDQIVRITGDKKIPEFQAGDTLRVHVRIVEGKNERIQVFEGLCIARKNKGLNSAFTVRKISHGEGVERIFPLYSPRIDKIEVVRRGVVRRAKLYYMRELTGKAARIKEKRDFTSGKDKKSSKKDVKPVDKEDSKPVDGEKKSDKQETGTNSESPS